MPIKDLVKPKLNESSQAIRQRVKQCRELQNARFKNMSIRTNSMMSRALMNRHCQLDKASEMILKTSVEKLGLSARAYDRVLKVSRTIADLESKDKICAEHVAEAIQYRSLDRQNWSAMN